MNKKLETYLSNRQLNNPIEYNDGYYDGFENAISLNLHCRFLNWCADDGWYRNGKRDEWYRLIKTKENKTTEELFNYWLDNIFKTD